MVASTKPSSEDDGEVAASITPEERLRRFNEAVVRRRRRERGAQFRHLLLLVASTKPSSEDDGECMEMTKAEWDSRVLQRSRRPKTTESS